LLEDAGVRQSESEEGEEVKEDLAFGAVPEGCVAGVFLVVLDGEIMGVRLMSISSI